MKKLLLGIAVFFTPLFSYALTQVYIPSTTTFHNYTVNIGSGTIRNLNASTLKATTMNGATTVNSTFTHTAQDLFQFGTAGAPSVSFSADPTTGLSGSAGVLNLDASAAHRMLIGASEIDLLLKMNPNSDLLVGLGDSSHRFSDLSVDKSTFSTSANITPSTGLKFNGNTAIPILQIQEGLLTNTTSFTTTAYTNTGLTVTITPKFNTSKIFLLVQANVRATNGGSGNCVANVKLLRGATIVRQIVEFMGLSSLSTFTVGTYSLVAYDAPATTSATTYTVQLANNSGNGTIAMNDDSTGTGTSAIYAVEMAQ